MPNAIDSHLYHGLSLLNFRGMADFQGYVILFLVRLISTISVRDFLKTRTTSCLPPSPLALPITGHLHLLTPISHQALRKLSKQYRPLIHIFLGSVPCVLASSPETAKEVLKTNEPSLSNRSHIAAANYLFYRSQDLSFAPYGSYWKFMKKLCRSEHLGGRTLDLLLSVRRDKIRRRIDLLSRKGKAGEAVDIGGELMRVTNNVISRMIMSERCSENKDEAGIVRKLIKEMSELTGKFNISDYLWFCKNLSGSRVFMTYLMPCWEESLRSTTRLGGRWRRFVMKAISSEGSARHFT